MDQQIDYIYYTATTTILSPDYAITGYQVTQSQYNIPFFDFLLVFLVLVFTVMAVKLTDYFCYPRNTVLKIKNYLRVSKKNNDNF